MDPEEAQQLERAIKAIETIGSALNRCADAILRLAGDEDADQDAGVEL